MLSRSSKYFVQGICACTCKRLNSHQLHTRANPHQIASCACLYGSTTSKPRLHNAVQKTLLIKSHMARLLHICIWTQVVSCTLCKCSSIIVTHFHHQQMICSKTLPIIQTLNTCQLINTQLNYSVM